MIEASSGRSAQRAADHRLGGVEILAALDRIIAEIIEQQRLVGRRLQAKLELGPRFGPALELVELRRARAGDRSSGSPPPRGRRSPRRAQRPRPLRRGGQVRRGHCRAAPWSPALGVAPRRAALGKRQAPRPRASRPAATAPTASSASSANGSSAGIRTSAASAASARPRRSSSKRRQADALRCSPGRHGARSGPGSSGSARSSPRDRPIAIPVSNSAKPAAGLSIAMPRWGRSRSSALERRIVADQQRPRAVALARLGQPAAKASRSRTARRPPTLERLVDQRQRFGDALAGAAASPRAARRRTAPAGCRAGIFASRALPSIRACCSAQPRSTGARKPPIAVAGALVDHAKRVIGAAPRQAHRRRSACARRAPSRRRGMRRATLSASAVSPASIARADRAPREVSIGRVALGEAANSRAARAWSPIASAVRASTIGLARRQASFAAAARAAPRSSSAATTTRLHVGIIGSSAAFGHDPVDVLGRVLDVARLAVDAVLRVDLKPR